MEFQDCVKFANENPICYVATMDGDQPRVRAFLMWYADQTGFYLATFSPKQVSRQIKENPNVELCFYNNPPNLMEARQMRVTGKAEFLDDKEIREKAFQHGAWMEPIAGVPLAPITEVFRVASGEAHFWTIPDILKEPQIERLKF
jgi:uncharacterized pyridoxamine 5'-phosphate oxidase family protein